MRQKVININRQRNIERLELQREETKKEIQDLGILNDSLDLLATPYTNRTINDFQKRIEESINSLKQDIIEIEGEICMNYELDNR